MAAGSVAVAVAVAVEVAVVEAMVAAAAVFGAVVGVVAVAVVAAVNAIVGLVVAVAVAAVVVVGEAEQVELVKKGGEMVGLGAAPAPDMVAVVAMAGAEELAERLAVAAVL